MAKKKKDLTEDMSIEDMAQAIVEHTGLAMEDLESFMKDETTMRAFYEQAMQGEPVPKSSFLAEDRETERPVLDSKGKPAKARKAPAARKPKKAQVSEKETFLKLSSGRKVNLGHVVCDKTDQAYNKGRNNFPVPHPEYEGHLVNIVFEMWPEITEEFPVAILDDYRIRAHALFQIIQVQVGPKTSGKFKFKVINRKGYTILSPTVSESEIKRMHDYLLSSVRDEAEMEALAARMVGD